MLNLDASCGVFGACEFVQLNLDDLGGDECISRIAAFGNDAAMDGVEERRFCEGAESFIPGPSIGKTGELDPMDARRVDVNCTRLARGSTYRTLRSPRGDGLGSGLGGGKRL